MSSDSYFDGDEPDSAFLREVDAIEAAEINSAKPNTHATPSAHVPHLPQLVRKPTLDSDEFDMTFDVDANDFAILDEFIVDTYAGKARPVAGPSKLTRQTTLFGGTPLPQPSKAQPTRPYQQRTNSAPRNPFGKKAPKIKKWDHTEFAKSGWKKPKGKGKGKANVSEANGREEEEEEEEEIEFDQFPAPFIPNEPSAQVSYGINADATSAGLVTPMKLQPDLLAAKDWVYPLNQSRRDYQFNIVKHCLFENTLVALPTGLGKTFIAGVVMLNYYKWFPEGKVIFVAPTKPLVAQQIEACHKTCGIPGRDAAELTGQNPRAQRARAWVEKRVFYMTPQTLMNDLATDNCDPRDIVLIVIDEAHKGTGDYAYAQVVRYMMAKNPHFRVLALTATPGGKPEAVQAIIDSLHISHIEIRDERSIDLKPYIFNKEVKLHVIKMTDAILRIRAPLVKLMETYLKRLNQSGLLLCNNVILLHPYRCQATTAEINRRPDSKQLAWAYPQLKIIGALARAMGYLMELSITMCHATLLDLSQSSDPSGRGSSKQTNIRNDPNFGSVMREIERQRDGGLPLHPKMEKLLSLVINHFTSVETDDEEGTESGDGQQTKMMVFVSSRQCVDEVVEVLNQQRPIIRATRFIGQGKDSKGKMGIAQSAQLEVIKKFKSGEYNVLVATSIGEEGLDIGEIDRIICYDSQKSPIRMLQRVGRTGRKRCGYVDVLLAEEREERNWDKSKESYEDVQQSIVRGDQLELFADVKRLLPDHIKPQCLQTVMEIEEYVRGTGNKGKDKIGLSSIKGKKQKRNADSNRNIPLGASSGFVSVSELLVKGAKKKTKTSMALDPLAAQDDDVDREIESGLSCGATAKSPTQKASISRAKGKKPAVIRKKKTVKSPVDYLSASQLKRRVVDDSDDIEIENGLRLSPDVPLAHTKSMSRRPRKPMSPVARHNEHTVDICSPQPCHISAVDPGLTSPLPLYLSDETSPRSSSEGHNSSRTLRSPSQPQASTKDSAWLLDSESESDSEVELIGETSLSDLGTFANPDEKYSAFATKHPLRHRTPFSPDSRPSDVQTANNKERTNIEMLPPALPSHIMDSPDTSSIPQSSFPVCGPRKPRLKAAIASMPSSSPLDMPPPSQRRLKRRQESSPPPLINRKRTKILLPNDVHNPWVDLEAVHSGDGSEGDSDVADVECESDRRFLHELPETQASPSYNQVAAYRLGLLTQAPLGTGGPAFASRPRRLGLFAGGRVGPRRIVSSSPERRDSEPDEYNMGSFVVHDDDPIILDISSSEL